MRVLATALVAVLIGLLLASSAATLYARTRVSGAQTSLDKHWLPAQTQVFRLQSAYIDEETGARGYLLTGNTGFLQPYTQGELLAGHLQRTLALLVAGDAVSTTLLRQVEAAHATWHRQVAVPEIAARHAGPLPQAQIDASALEGKRLFDALRTTLSALADRVALLIHRSLDSVSDAQLFANIVTAATVALALLAAGLALPVTRRVLTRPLESLLASLRRVASGDYDEEIEPVGAAELVAMAQSAEQMRQSLIRRSDELVHVQQTLTLWGERDRMAADLHDRSIQRMFALGLSLTSLTKRHPDLRETILPLIDQTDAGIKELREIIFNLSHPSESNVRDGIDQIARDAARVLGFAPEIQVHGPVEQVLDEPLARELLAVLREALSNVARHARASTVQVTVRGSEHHIDLVVSDDGVGIAPGPRGHGLRNMEARAAHLGGRFEVRAGGFVTDGANGAGGGDGADGAAGRGPGGTGGTTLEWHVPLAAPPNHLPTARS